MERRILRRESLLLGDSITQYGFSTEAATAPGWVSILADEFIRKVDIINRGYSGYNTRKVRAILPIVLGENRREKLLFSTLCLGANDAAPLDDTPLCSGVPVGEYEDNMVEIAQELLQISDNLVIIAPPPVDADGSMAMGRTMDNTRQYAEAAERVAKKLGVLFVNAFADLQSEAQWEKDMLIDGVHLTGKGNTSLAKAVLKALAVKGITPEDIAWDLPGWRDLCRENPAASLTRDHCEKLGCRNTLDTLGPLK
uniref:SGNH hydrolase-type esterase domain-containing protein n=1 Tax=Pyrodinium bahamense TaxID=73915 RepID=A0A7S0FJG7_9DINO|mmetsp:Transcript_34389/g.95085  ORF Transcript_34389/g.95085 Transcript_34389/m.95085 type:complete len:254 (+) Transcript_34389:85-846(+)